MFNAFYRADKSKLEDTEVMIFPNTEWKFDITDGYIEYCNFAINLLIDDAKNQDIKNAIYKLYRAMNKLQDKFVRFDGSTEEEVKKYAELVSHVFEKDCFDVNVEIIKAFGKSQCEDVIDEYAERKRLYFLCFDSEEECKKKLRNDVIEQLSSIRMSKDKDYKGPSIYLTKMKYHEHIHDAINELIQTLVYAFNCYSFRNEKCFYEDIDYIEKHIEYAKTMVERIEHVI